MDVEIDRAEKIGRKSEICRARAEIAHRCGEGFLEHIARLPREVEAALTGHLARLDEHHLAAERSITEARGDPGARRDLGALCSRGRGPEDLLNEGSVGFYGLVIALGDVDGDGAAERRDLPIELPHAELIRIVFNELVERLGRDIELDRAEPMLFELARRDEIPSDGELLFARISGQLNDLHTIVERPRDGSRGIRCGDEHHLAEIDWDIEIMVVELAVLFGIENLEER